MRRSHVVALLAGAFILRLAYGLSSELFGPDESQVFLIGLQYYTTGAWPYYGADVVYTHTQLPGALQGLLVGGPLFLVAQPEAPYVLLNLLSFGALAFLAWYIGRRLPGIPRWFLWPWVFFSPWTLNYSTYILNNSYVLPSAVLFFVGACELVPALRVGAISRRTAFFCLGVGMLWTAQMHLSSVLLIPIAIGVMVMVAREDRRHLIGGLPWLVLGASLAGATLVPTLLHNGVGAVISIGRSNVQAEPRTILSLPLVVARYFSLASFELARFVGASSEQRFGFLSAYPWAAPFAVVAGALGVLQTLWLIVSLFRRGAGVPHWPAVRTATWCLLGLVGAAFTLSVKGPASHAFYVMLPAVFIYSFYCWAPVLAHPIGRKAAVVLLVSGGVALTALGVRNFGLRSLYTNRPLVVRAIVEKNYHLVGERRPDIWRAEGR